MSRRMIALFAASLASVLATESVRAEDKFVEGRHYETVSSPQSASSPTDRIEVAVVFMYGCPHCFALEPRLRDWMSRMPSDVDVVFLPAAFNETAKLHAKAFYSAQSLGVLDKVHDDLFRAIHVDKRDLSTQTALRDFFGAHGIDAAAFDTMLGSAGVEDKARHADELIKSYGIKFTPTVVVNGRYRTALQWAGSYEVWFELLDDLIARERASSGSSGPTD